MAVSPKAVVRELAGAVVDLLNAQTFSENFHAVREWLAVNEIEEAEAYLVQVVPDTRIVQRSSRARIQHDATINVTVQKRHGDSNPTQIAPVKRCDAIADFAQEIEDFLLGVDSGAIATANLKAAPLIAEIEMDDERMATLGIVAVNIAVQYRLWR